MSINHLSDQPFIGVGLRHAHFAEALAHPAPIDFIELHSENFFTDGGAIAQVLQDVAQQYPVSLHSTAMGLGSAAGIPEHYLLKLDQLASQVDPILISDHASFAWGEINGKPVHSGDLLPIVYNDSNLAIMAEHVNKIQQRLGKQLLVENLSAYIVLPGSTMTEQEFLVALTEKTQCGLLLDLNNILVNGFNTQQEHLLGYALEWINNIPTQCVGEIHLAGYRPVDKHQIAIDDHSHPVSDLCWQLYAQAMIRFGNTPTLIEWDNDLPSWSVLIDEVVKARNIGLGVLNRG